MQHIRSISDLNPQSEGFANRATESINIIGNVLSDIVNGFGDALSGIGKTGLSQNRSNLFIEPQEIFNPNDPNPREAIADAIRVQHEIDKSIAQI